MEEVSVTWLQSSKASAITGSVELSDSKHGTMTALTLDLLGTGQQLLNAASKLGFSWLQELETGDRKIKLS